MDDRTRTQLLVAGLVGTAVAAVLASFVYGIVGGEDQTPLRVADVEGTWTAEDGGGARLFIRGDGSAEVSKEVQIRECAALMWADGRAVRAAWTFGDIDDPRTVFLRLQGPEAADTCHFDFTVADEGNRTSGPWGTFVRSDVAH
ncbi:hypothetical protein ACODT3_15375 [Streptomyces sp. 4.24]|uniref:hypothetical protein n=1 Tax=Streptomyces tritrimontium TaxID=3406573 RepID=UPI003BB56C95